MIRRIRTAAAWLRHLSCVCVCLGVVVTTAASPAGAITIQRVTANGIEAWLVEDHTNPIIALEIAFRGGAALDPPGKEGLASFAMSLLDEGAGDLSSAAFQALLEDHSIELRFDAEHDSVRGSLKTLSRDRDLAFGLLKLALTAPRFDAEPVARVRSQIQAMLRRQSEDPDVVADRALFAALFPGHPYARPVDGTVASLASIAPQDLRAFASRRLNRRDLIVGVVGDIDPGALATLLQSTFAALSADGGDDGGVADISPERGLQKVVAMTVPQSAIAFAQATLARADPDYYAFSVVNQVLGGAGLTSRLFSEVREKRGLAYGIYTRPDLLDHAPLLVGRAATANERVGETVQIIREQWRRMAEDGLTPAELADAKRYLTGSFPLRFSSSPRIAAILVAIQRDRLGLDYPQRYEGYIDAVTLDDANRVANRVLDPSSLSFVIVGQPTGLFEQQ